MQSHENNHFSPESFHAANFLQHHFVKPGYAAWLAMDNVRNGAYF